MPPQAPPTTEQSEPYDRLLKRVRRIANVGSAASVLHWDQEVMMPEGGTPARAQQLSTLSALGHELLTAAETGELLDAVDAQGAQEGDGADDARMAVVREVRRHYERATRVPTDLVEEISRTTSEALPVWQKAREASDFGTFAPKLERLVELKRRYAEHIDADADPYEVLFADYEPYLPLDTAERALARLRERLVPLIDAIRDAGDLDTGAFRGGFAVEAQQQVVRDALDLLGYPWDHGRLDVSSHPFSSGNQFDARITTRFQEDDPLDALGSTIHEFGHALYELGLPREHYGTPLGESRDLTVHESQSRLWENHVGRSLPFWQLFLPRMSVRFPRLEDATPMEAYRAANEVRPDNLIRVEADELTYHMHILLRFEVERDLIHGDLEVADVPEVWNDKMEAYLGVRPPNDAKGCLQDIHWSHGSFGYFPTYTLGSVLAAQLYAAAEADIDDLQGKVRSGDFEPLREWLVDNVHRHGQRYTTPELVRVATGKEFSADDFLSYAEGKFGELYGL